MTLFLKQKMVVAGSLLCLSLMAGAVYSFDVAAMMPKRVVSLPEIQFDSIKATNQGLPVLAGHLFGPLPDSAMTLTETNLNLTLMGTVPISAQEGGMAIIMVGAKPEQAIRVGDEVLQGVTLDAVYGKYVVLNRSNGKEILRFPNSGEKDELLQPSDASKALSMLNEDSGEEASIGLTVSN